MRETHDTIDGLLAEFRGYSAGMPASYHVTMSWADFRKMLDRFEAAHRREVATTKESLAVGNSGDCVKLREALKAAYDKLLLWNYTDGDTARMALGVMNKIDAALAAPPRNCDAMDWRTAWKIWREKFHPETPAGYSAVVKGTEAFMDWFTSPATEKEGGAR